MTATLRRIVAFARGGVFLGGLLSCLALLASLLTWSTTLHLRADHSVNVFVAVVVYILGGAVGGVIAGVLFPLLRWSIGAAVVGVAALFPTALAVSFTIRPANPHSWIVAAITAVVLGGICGPGYREIFRDELPPDWGV